MKTLLLLISLISRAEWQEPQIVKETQPVLILQGQYQIPSASESENEFSIFSIEKYHVLQIKGNVPFIEVQVPKDLIAGKTQTVKLYLELVNNDEKILTGEESSAYCIGKWSELKCDVQFPGNQISASEHGEYLKNQYGDSQKSKALLSMSMRFSGEPIGKFWTVKP